MTLFSPYITHGALEGARLHDAMMGCMHGMAWLTLICDPWCTSVVQHGYYPEMTGQQYRARRPRRVARAHLD